ncbi:MAG: MFS transporter [Chitinophagaceae bacterium]|nr:MFS transporter [Chitinophagaceae bacterium]
MRHSDRPVQLGLKENLQQFVLLIIVNAFVGAMIGIERSILPEFAAAKFNIASTSVLLSFIMIFGISKAIANYFSGFLAAKYSRKKILVLGWIIAFPVPLIFIYAPSWSWIVFANVLLGIHQGFTWSSTVAMKIDLVGQKNRGFAMGLNEFAGYVAVALMAFFTAFIADRYGIFPYPFYLGLGVSIIGLILSIVLVRDTAAFVQTEAVHFDQIPRLKNIFIQTSWKNRQLGAVTQAGLINNLNDGMIWGLLPIILIRKNFGLVDIGIITSIYPAVWGLSQIITGKLADLFSKKMLLFWGMLVQAIAIILLTAANSYTEMVLISTALGIGTALVYPTFLATISDNTHALDRGKSLGIFRFWRDSGYAIGAVITGITADQLGINTSIILIGILTLLSAFFILFRMKPQPAFH